MFVLGFVCIYICIYVRIVEGEVGMIGHETNMVDG